MSAGGAALMSCVREGSLEPPYRPPQPDTHNHGEGRTGRFLRGLRRMFKRRGSNSRTDASPDPKSSSTSELRDADRHQRRKEGAYGSGLSVSHDSVFTGERSGDESSDDRHPATNTSQTNHRAELVAAVRRRGGRGDGSDDDEDLGLPRSPPASPPTDKADKRHHAGISHSSCSDGSLLSVGSSEMDEDSSSGHHHDHSARSDHSDLYHSSEPPMGVAPLSHSAARHKMAVRPRRTHGAPRRKKNNPIASALPITPELNEEMIRSTTPDVTHRTQVVAESFSSSSSTKQMIIKEQQLVSRDVLRVVDAPNDVKSKSSSLPPGLALSQLTSLHTPKLTIAENTPNTPRSSIKRSKSSTQDQTLNSPKVDMQYHSEERMTKYREKKAEETCLEKKSKSEKKVENEVIRSKREESFFSRLLLRKSGKKSKKEPTETDGQEVKKSKTEKTPAQYKTVDETKHFAYEASYKPAPNDRTHKTTGQKVFANQMHKRIDTKGGYVQDGAYKDVYSAAKVPGLEYDITDLKTAEETDKMLNLEMKSRFSRREEFSEKIERKRTTSKEALDVKESFVLQQDRAKRPTSVQRLVDPFSSKAFITNEQTTRAQEDSLSPSLVTSDEEPPLRGMKIIKKHNDYVFHSGSMPKNIPYFNPSVVVPDGIKTIRHQSSENVKHLHRSSEYVSDFEKVESKRQTVHHKPEDYTTGLRSLGDEYVETRSSIGKSHSFRYASETTSISSQDSQMPSLPAIVGISEPLLQSWEVNYRRNVSDRHDFSKRVSARNYNLMQGETYDSLPSTDSSYLDSLKTDVHEEGKLFTNSIHIVDAHKRDSDISQIEAKIDDIISSPKPIIASMLKSSSLDSVKSSPEKPVEDRRKTISIESALSHGSKNTKLDENFISVTHINREQTPVKTETKNKSDEKIPKIAATTIKPGVPEFLNIQLNRVDAKPSTNVVLTANVTPKKPDSPVAEKEQEIEIVKVAETKPIPAKRESIVSKFVESVIENKQIEEKSSPINIRKSVQPIAPQSPSPPKTFFKRKSTSVELQDKHEKPRTNSMSTEGSIEKIYDNISMDQKSHSSFGSKSSIQSTDSNEKTPDRQDEGVVYRKKHVLAKELRSSERKNDDEPELLKVFARRSLKIKDSEADNIAQEIAENKEENSDNANRTKLLKNEFNASIKSRDSDKENEDTKEQDEKRLVDIAARVSQFGAAKMPHYQRSVSINTVPNPKRESAPINRSEVNKYKKEVSDSTPEKRLRNRTFPDPSNESKEAIIKADTLTKRWQKTETSEKSERWQKTEPSEKSAVIEGEGGKEKQEGGREKEEEGAGPAQYRGILHMRAQWERRAQQGTK